MEFILIKVICILILFGIILPSFDGYSDIILAYHLLSGTYWTKPYYGPPKKQPIFGTMVLIPIILGTLFTIPHWLRRENTWRKRLKTLPLLILQFWPQWETIKVLRLVWRNDNKWKDEKEKLDKEISPLEPFLESIPQVCIISVIASNDNVLSIDHILPTYTLSVFSAAFGITKFLKAGPCRLIPYDEINFGLSFLLILNIGSHIIGKGISLAGSLMFSQYFHGYISLAVTTWICLSLLPQIIFGFVSIWISLGFKHTISIIGQYPALILMPAFSFWTVGPMSSANIIISYNSSCGKSKTVGVSYLHSWINVGLTTLGQFSLACLCLPKSFWTDYDWDDFIRVFVCSLPFLFSVIVMILIQLLSPCKNVCFSTDRTLLNVEDPFKTTHLQENFYWYTYSRLRTNVVKFGLVPFFTFLALSIPGMVWGMGLWG